MQKFKQGDSVTIIGYGHLMWFNKNSEEYRMLKESGRLPIIKETDDIAWVDVCPHLVGQKGIIDGTSAPYTTVDNQTKCDYSLKLIDMEGKTAWYNEEQLELNN